MKKVLAYIALVSFACGSQLANAQKRFVKKTPIVQQTAQTSATNVWVNVSANQAPAVPMRLKLKRYSLYKLNVGMLRAQFKTVAPSYEKASVMSIPMPNGTVRAFKVWETPMMEAQMAEQYPDIKTYTGEALDDRRVTAKFDFTLFGFHSVIFDGEQVAFIDPYDQYNDGYYVLHYKSDEDRAYSQRMSCKVHTDNDLQTDKMQLLPTALPATDIKQLNILAPQNGLSATGMVRLPGTSPTMEAVPTNGTSIRTYRIAVSANNQYCVAATGITSPTIAQCLSSITTSMNRVNGVYNRELAVQLNFVANESDIIWPSASGSANGADPFSSINSDALACINQNQVTCDARIGNANYDVGHLFTTGAGGLAALGVICNTTNKARGVTGSSFPVGDAYDIDYVCHELGHQFGSNHTFNNNVDNACAGNASAANAYEPASGATIMDYAGICSPDNIQLNSDAYFSARSLDRIQLHMSGSGGTCASTASSGHSPLTVGTFVATYNIPYKTPFELTSPTATAGSGDTAITYCWHQANLGDFGMKLSQTFVNGPIFRSYLPVYQPSRIFPRLSNVLSGTLSNTGEKAPDTTRYLTFRTVIRNVRAGMGCFNIPDDTVHLNVFSTGATNGYAGFRVTSQNSAVTYTGGSTQTVTWNVVGTNASPVNAANVDIYMSTDGGNTWPHFIGTFANTGTASVTIPNPGSATTAARIKVKGSGNVFFNVNSSNFTVNPGTMPITGTFTVCTGSTTDLDDATPSGTWSSSTPSVGTVNSTTGVVTGIAAGTTTITYHVGSGNVTATVSVIATPTVAVTTGTASVCVGNTTTLTNTTASGVWSSTNTAAGTVSASGVVMGIAAGTTVISYTVANVCGTVAATTPVVVNATVTVAAITGASSSVCVGNTISLNNSTSSGVWSSASTAVGTVNSSGTVRGISAGTTTISYTVTGICGPVASTRVVTVFATPTVTVTGGATVPEGTSTVLSASGGTTYTWRPPNALSATTGSSVSATAYGTVVYTITAQPPGGGCSGSTTNFTVTATPAPSPNINIFAGGGASTADGVMATAAVLTNPADIFIDASGNKYVALNPSGGNKVRKISPAGIITTVAGAGGTNAFTPDGGAATASVLHNIASVVVDASGNIYIAEEGARRVRKVDAATGILTTIAGNGSSTGATSDGIQATAASILPRCVRLNGGYLYISCSSTHRIRRVNLATGVITTVAGNGSAGTTGDGVMATSTSLNLPVGIVFDGAGNMYFSNVASGLVNVVATDGRIYRVAGNGFSTFNGDGIATANSLGAPYQIAMDTSGNLLVADIDHGRLRKVIPSIGIITTVAGNGVPGSGGNGGPATAANLVQPISVATDASGNIYVCDWGGGQIRIIGNTCATPTISIAGGDTICAGSSATLTASGGSSYSWTPSAGLSATSGASVVASPTTTTTYTVTGGTGACTNTATVTIVVNPLPTITVAPITGSASVCTGSTTTLNSTTASGVWSSTNTAVGTVSVTGVVTGIAAGTTTISYTVTEVCGSVAATRVVTVSATPTVNVTGGGTIAQGASTTLTASGASSYTWTPPNVLSATTGSSVTATAFGTVVYTVTGTSGTCGSGAATVTVTGTPPASPNIYNFAGGGSTEADSVMATAAVLTNPTDIYIDASGTKYITLNPSGGNRVRKISPAGIVTTVAGAIGPNAFTPDGGAATASVLHVIRSAVADAAGNVYIAEEGSNRVRKVDAATGILTTIAGNGSATGAASDGIQATAASMTPVSVRLNGGYLYIACSASHRVRRVNLATGVITTVAGNGSAGFSGEAVAATATGLINPWGMAFDGAGNMYISQVGAAVISVVRPDGKIYRVAGIPTNYTFNGDGVANTKTLGAPYQIALDGSGNLLVPDFNHNRLRKIFLATGMMTTIAGTGPNDGTGDGGPATAANLAWPFATATDVTGNIYVCDWLGARVRVIGSVCTTPTIGIAGADTICAGSSLTLTASGSSAYSWAPSTGLSATSGASVVASPTVTTTYTVTGGVGTCTNTASVTVVVNPLPTVTGSAGVCIGSSITLSGSPAGGSWAASNGNATVSPAGDVTGVSSGAVVIRYTLPTGCYKDHTVNVGTAPSVSASGGASVCSGTSAVLTASGAASYSWSPASGLSSTTGSSVTATPTITTTYTVVGTVGGSCAGAATVTVNVSNSFPISAGGNVAICSGSSTTLAATGSATSYTWAPLAGLSATTGASVTATPTITTTYTLTGTSGFCTLTRTVTVSVNASPTPITGTFQWCKNTTTTLSCTPSGGAWSSSNSSIGSINSTTGVVYGAGAGTALISYTISGCAATKEVTVLATPAIGGVSSICPGLTTTLTNAVAGGIWTSSADTIASIDAGTGLLTAIEEGTTTITYTAGTGCIATKQFTVGLPPAFTTGPWVCLGQTSQIGHPISGGVWSSSNPARATVDAVTGVVYGVSLGNFYISYTLATGCVRTMEMAVQTFPMNISGSLNVCAGSSTNLSNETISGTWSSSDESVATITLSTGTAYGLTQGTTNITYKFQACYRAAVLSVNPLPAVITGADQLCGGSNAAYTTTPTGGTWSSSNTSVATIGSVSGIATGGTTSGAVTITYTSPVGCRATKNIIVNPQPGALSGTTSLCAGAATTISSASPAGTWASSNGTVATVGSTLSLSTTLTAIAAGTTTVTTTTDMGCSRSMVITVTPGVTTINGDAILCPGNTLALTNATTGGTWSSSNTSVATIGTSGIVTGAGAGVVTITYRTSATCYATKQITVNPIPGAITGGSSVCLGSSITLAHADAGGTWSSSVPARATIDAVTGVVTGISTGGTTITYQINSGCFKTLSFSVNAAPAAISGPAQLCQGATVAFTNTTTGGAWSSSNTSIASVPSTPGNVTGVNVGVATISYVVTATGCFATKDVTVNAQPTVIGGGSNQLCVGSVVTYTSTPTGGTWISSAPSFASIDAVSGQMTGIGTGTLTLSYTLSTGCSRTMVMTVNPLPAAIGGTASVCKNATTTLSCSTIGGTWTSAAVGTASVTPSGVVTGVAAGMTNITYKLTATGCQVTRQVTVNDLPTGITGANQICVGNAETYGSTPTGGSWLSGTTATATIGSATGIAAGVAQGITVLTYTAPVTGCRITKQITVNALPGVITGTVTTICVGNSTTLTAGTASQTWSSTTTAVSVTPTSTSTALVQGLTAGSTVVSYTNAFGCARTITINVNPAVPAITGDLIVCPTRTVTLANSLGGGTWSTALATRATVNAAGVVTGVNAGNVNISYIVSPGCNAVANVTINAVPAAITGPTSVCVGSEIDMNHATAGGTWSTSSALISLNPSNGIVGGVAAGTPTITYSINSGCWVTTTVNVKTAPAAITGSLAVAVGSTSALANSVAGGTWSSSATGIATVGTSGVLTGIATGNATITYKLTATLCYVTATATVTGAAGRAANEGSMNDMPANIRMYPNPTQGVFTVESAVSGKLGLYTLDGKDLSQYNVTVPQTEVKMPADLTPGVYMCRFEGVDGSSYMVRVVYTP